MKHRQVKPHLRTELILLGKDRFVQACLLIFGVGLAGVFSASQGSFGSGLGIGIDSVLGALTLLALLWGRSALTGAARGFWHFLAAAWACLLLVELFFIFDPPLPVIGASFVADLLHVVFYLVFALAIDLRPHRSEASFPGAARFRLESVAGILVVFGLLIYFGLEVLPDPLGLSLSFVQRQQGPTPFLLVRLSLDLLIFSRLLQVWTESRGFWRRTYTLLALAVLCFAIKDALSIAQFEGIVSIEGLGLVYQGFLFLPNLLVIVAARSRRFAVDDESAAGDPREPGEPGTFHTSPLALYALVVPGMHFLLYPLGVLNAATRGPREAFCLLYLLVLGTLAWLHQRAMTKDSAQARRALRRAEIRLFRAERLEAVGRLAGGIAHDFNNYLTVILGCAELVQEKLTDPEARADLGYVREAADKAAHLTSQLLAFGRRQLLRPEPLDLNEVVTSTGSMLERLLGEDIELEIDLGADAGFVLADLGHTEQVVVNLALNSRDAMLGGGTLTVSTRRVELSEDEAEEREIDPGTYAELTITDTGSGMSEEVRARAFEPFFTTKDSGSGTGLGLSTVHGIVIQSGGSVEVDSVVGRGTTMRVLLPAADPPGEPEKEESGGEAPVQAATVLLVEDEPSVRRLAERALSQRGFGVLVAANGQEAIELASVHRDAIDVLVTDVVMPGQDGFELARALTDSSPGLRVLFISGYPTDTLRERRLELPPSVPLLNKPFTPSILVREVQRLLLDVEESGTAAPRE